MWCAVGLLQDTHSAAGMQHSGGRHGNGTGRHCAEGGMRKSDRGCSIQEWVRSAATLSVCAEDTAHMLSTTDGPRHSSQGLYIKEGYKTKRSDSWTSLIRCETRSESPPLRHAAWHDLNTERLRKR